MPTLTCDACAVQVCLSPVILCDELAADKETAATEPSTKAPALVAHLQVGSEVGVTAAESESAAAAGGSGMRTVPVPYVVCPHDTWQSICLRHRMTTAELLRLNGLRNPRARVGDVLMVWAERSDEQQNEDWKRQLVRQFRRQTGSGASETLYYLEQHEYSIGDAIRERQHDLRFETERATCVRTILDEDALRAKQRAEDDARRRAEEAEATALVEEARRRQARAAAHAEALRSLNACLAPPNNPNSGAKANCLTCLG